VPEETWQRINATMTNLSFGVDEKLLSRTNRTFLRTLRQWAVFAESDQIRNYPNDSLAAQVIGFSGIEENRADGRAASQIVGRDGIEFSMNKPLSGVAGWRMTETDRQQHELVALRDEDVHPRDGLNVVLTIDEAVQHIVETALVEALQKHTPKSITGIVIRPRTGEILAMASLPNYNPNDPNTVSTNGRNRVINDIVEPGSTFKIVVVSGALNDGIVKLTDEFFCENGHFAFAGRVLHDHEAFPNLTVKGIITKSSNIGAAKIGIKLGEQSLYDYAWNYGFGQRTGIPLPGEQGGILNSVKHWSKVSIAQIPMGHGVAVTRLQMAMAMAAIANDGWLMRPMIVSQLQERDGGVVERYTPQRVRQVISDATCKQMIEALKTVATKEGTAAEAALKNYVVAGKTGTAQKVENGTYASGKYISSFIGFFPAEKPELLISVVMDEPKEGYYGGKVCGPVFRDIAERCASYLNIPPDPNLMTNAPPLVAENGSRKF
jgi:cell division protein FtsI/penicillin-binding protein 2